PSLSPPFPYTTLFRSNWGALFGLLSGAIVAFVWGQVSIPMTDQIYEIIPGFAVNLIVAVVVSRFTYKHDEEADREFDESVALSRVRRSSPAIRQRRPRPTVRGTPHRSCGAGCRAVSDVRPLS